MWNERSEFESYWIEIALDNRWIAMNDVIALYFYLYHFILHEFTFPFFKLSLSLRVDIARKGGEKEKSSLIGLSVVGKER